MDLKGKIKKLPDAPGVYLMKDARNGILYVGKAVSLRKRVASYFQKAPAAAKTDALLARVVDIDVIVVEDERAALLLEADLVKRYRPPYNILLKDDKSFPYIKISREAFPRVLVGRRKKNETGFDYFGPYTDASLLRRALKILRKTFPFCSCRRFPKKVCLNYHIGLCPGPCQGLIARRRYLRMIRDLSDFLTSGQDDLTRQISLRMRRCVEKEDFEGAAGERDRLEALGLLAELKNFDTGSKPTGDFQRLGLSGEPRRIEAFDISNIGSDSAVGSMVSFWKGAPDKSQYRRFKIRTVSGIDDYAMMREVVRRRYERLKKQRARMPDLVVIDGGQGHLQAAASVLAELGLDLPIIGIAKKEELVYTVGDERPVRLERNSFALKLFQRLRDEAHRFAQKYHHWLRRARVFS